MALPNEAVHRFYNGITNKFRNTNGEIITKTVPSYDDWDRFDAPGMVESYEQGASVEAGLSGRTEILRSHGPDASNSMRSYHVNGSNDKKREKRASAQRSIRSR